MWETSRPSARSLALVELVTAKKGGNATCCNCSSDLRTVATSSSGERSASPAPGKCFATTVICSLLPVCNPDIYALPICPTQNGSPPNTREPKSAMADGLGASTTSSEGPKYKLNPKVFSSLPNTAPT